MNFKNMFKKGQSLPLNTIVIAILVILVLLVIIVFFTTQVGETGSTLDENSVSQCTAKNPALATLGYNVFEKPDEEGNCPTGTNSAVGVSNCCVGKSSE